MDKIITITEVRRHFGKVMDDVYYNHHSYLVTRRGVPLARITPIDAQDLGHLQAAEAVGSQ